jgi:hypothetical protein
MKVTEKEEDPENRADVQAWRKDIVRNSALPKIRLGVCSPPEAENLATGDE